MAELPGFLGIHEIIGVPGQGYERPDDPTLPYVLLSGDELLHLVSMAQARRIDVRLPDHDDKHEHTPDPTCPLCTSLFGYPGGKVPQLLAAAAPLVEEGGES